MAAVAYTSEGLASWAGEVLGGRVLEWRQLLGGNSRTTYVGSVQTATGTLPIVVRAERGDGPFADTPLTLAREVRMYRALAEAEIAVPQLLAVSDDEDAIVLSRVPGSDDWSERVLDDLLAALAELHRLDPAPALQAGFAPTARADLDLWAEIARQRVGHGSPYLDFAFDFLARHFPGEPPRTVICHGDVGPGNVLHDGTRLTGLLDWEFSHVGDPIDDLAWITVRSVLFGLEAPDFADRVRSHYVDRAGVELDAQRLAFWQAMVVLRNLVTCLASIANPVRGRDRLIHFMLVPPLQVMLLDAIARIAGLEPALPAPLEPLAGMGGLDVLEEIVRGLPTLVDAIEDPEVRTRGKRMKLLGGQLAANLALAPAIVDADRAEAQASAEAERLAQLSRRARRELLLFPHQRQLAEARFASFDL